ncbi:hypothetical protein IKP85_06015 [bacterium]|nr:hypothetical protein [bacterium]
MQGWTEDDNWWLSHIPDKFYYYAPYEPVIHESIAAKEPQLSAKGIFSGIVLKVN